MKTNADRRQIRIAVIIRNFSSYGGGAERYCVELTKKLSKIYEVHIFSQENTERLPEVFFHKVPKWINKPRFLNLLLFSYMTNKSTNNKFDIIHSHDRVSHANIYTLHVPCFKSKWTSANAMKKISLWFGALLSPRELTYLWLEKKVMSSVAQKSFISVSEYLSLNILQNYPKLEGNITIAYPGSEIKNDIATFTDYRTKLKIPKNAFILVFVAHGFKRKGLPAVIKALELLENSHIYLIVVGRGDATKIKISSSLVKKNIFYIGSVDDINSVYKSANALVHPTLGDTYGMVIVEAMSNNLPVIVSSSKYCGFSEHLSNKEALLIENPRDAQEIKTLIKKIYKNPDLRKSLSKNALRIVKQINWEESLKQTVKAYENYLKKN